MDSCLFFVPTFTGTFLSLSVPGVAMPRLRSPPGPSLPLSRSCPGIQFADLPSRRTRLHYLRGRPSSSRLPHLPLDRKPARKTPFLSRHDRPFGTVPNATPRVSPCQQGGFTRLPHQERKVSHVLLLRMLVLGPLLRPLRRQSLCRCPRSPFQPLSHRPSPFASRSRPPPPPPICLRLPPRTGPRRDALRPELRVQPLSRGGRRSYFLGRGSLRAEGSRQPLPRNARGCQRPFPATRKEDVDPKKVPEG